MIIEKRTLKIKYGGLFLFLMMIGMNLFAAEGEMICVDWEYVSIESNVSYKENPMCFYEVGDGTGDYCIEENTNFQVNSDGHPCGYLGDGCGKDVSSFWVYVGKASGDCSINGVRKYIFPISDTYVPFILLLGVYGVSIYCRKKKCAAG